MPLVAYQPDAYSSNAIGRPQNRPQPHALTRMHANQPPPTPKMPSGGGRKVDENQGISSVRQLRRP